MVDNTIIQKLVIERCRLHVSHLCALKHLSSECIEADGFTLGVFESLNRDLQVLEDLMRE